MVINKKQKGFTLVELLLVVGLIALGSVVAYITYPKVQATSRANTEMTYINTLSSGIASLFSNSASYAGLGTTGTAAAGILINSRMAPDKLINGTTLVNSFGGTINIISSNLPAASTADAYYRMDFPMIPRAECVKLVTGVGNNFNQVSVNGLAPANMAKQFPTNAVIDPAAAANVCNADNNTIYFWGK